MEQGSIYPSFDEVGFAKDLAELGAQALRDKYRREASSHAAMKRRCREGGFDLDPVWEDFREFLRDMGPRPFSDASIDRLNPTIRRYGPGLCRWASKTEQTANRRNTIWLEFRGERIGLKAFADLLGAPYSTIHSRHAKGETPEAIAKHYARESTDHGYRPPWISDDEALQKWRAEYNRWLKRVPRDRRGSAQPEVYAAILASEALDGAYRKMDRIMDEVAPSDLASVERKYARDLRITGNAVDWIKDALRTLAQREKSLAARLVPRHGEWRELWKFEKWLIPPPEED